VTHVDEALPRDQSGLVIARFEGVVGMADE
jgi:hypothetical protein